MAKRYRIIAVAALGLAAFAPPLQAAGGALFAKVVEANLLVAFDAIAFGLRCL